MIIPCSFLFFPKLYFNKKLVFPLYIFTIVLAILGLLTVGNSDSTKPNFYLFLICPIYSLSILRIELYLFKKYIKRNPKYPPRNFFLEDDGLGWDRVFYFTFMFLSTVSPLGILAYYFP
jgi:hypothetical protein